MSVERKFALIDETQDCRRCEQYGDRSDMESRVKPVWYLFTAICKTIAPREKNRSATLDEDGAGKIVGRDIGPKIGVDFRRARHRVRTSCV